jgi:hypothetical protein
MTFAFEFFWSHCHIFKELDEFLGTMGNLIIFREGNFMFSVLGYGLVTKSLGVGCTFEEVVDKTKCWKMNVNPFITKLEWMISSSF